MTICDLYSWVRWIQITVGKRRKDDVCGIGASTETIKDCSHWYCANMPTYTIYKYMVTVYVMHTCIHCKTKIFTSSFIKPGWSKLHSVTLVLCWSTGGFAHRGRTAPAGQTSRRGPGLRSAWRNSPFSRYWTCSLMPRKASDISELLLCFHHCLICSCFRLWWHILTATA